MAITTINLTNKPFLCSDRADAAAKAKRYANQSGKAWWFYESNGSAYCAEVPDGVPIPGVRAGYLHDGIEKVIIAPGAL